MGLPRVNPSSKGEMSFWSDKLIASFNQCIISDFGGKINCNVGIVLAVQHFFDFVVVFSYRVCYNFTKIKRYVNMQKETHNEKHYL